MTKDALLEQLAAIEHVRWSDWQTWVHEQAEWMTPRGPVMISGDVVLRWERHIATPYAALSEQDKASDREQVDRYWPLIVAFVAEWLDDVFRRQWIDAPREQLLQYWREEMEP